MAQTVTAPSGSGTAADPYQIVTLDNLYWLSQASAAWSKHFVQMAGIDATETCTWNISGTDTLGLFDDMGSGSTIDSLGLINVNVTGRSYTGGLVGFNFVGTISCSFV